MTIPTQLYKLTSPSGKQYIGVTKTSLKRRISGHISCQSAVGNALRKYGIEDFKIEILVIGDEEYIYDLEKKAIEAFKTMAPYGYNLKEGGEGGRHAEETKQKLSESVKQSYTEGRVHPRPMLGKRHAEETKQEMSEAHKQYYAEGGTHPRGMLGKKHSEETRLKMSKSAKLRHIEGPTARPWQGKKHSEETKQKMSEATKRYWTEKKRQEMNNAD